jgi:hypothetical protein
MDGAQFVATEASSDASVVDVSSDPSSWGRLAHQSSNARSSVYERHNVDGSKTVTHVYWTHEAAEACASCDHRSAQ